MFLICFEPPDVLSHGNRKKWEAVLPSHLGYHHSEIKQSHLEVLVQRENQMRHILKHQFSKDKNEVSTTNKRLTELEFFSSPDLPKASAEHYQNWHKKPHPYCKTEKKTLNSITV